MSRRAPYKLGKLKYSHITQAIQIALVIVLLTSFFFYTRIDNLPEGLSAINILINAGVAIAVSFVIEMLFLRSRGRWVSFKDCYVKENPLMIPLLVVLLLPLHAPLYVVFIATVMAVWIGKLVYGGFGYSIFHPAIVGVLFAYLSFRGQLATPEGIAYPIEMLKNASALNEIAMLSQQPLFFGGMYYGISVGTASGLVLVALMLLLAIPKIIDWRLSITYLATIFGITYLMGGSYFAMEHLLSGTVLFAAVFLVTDHVTSPTSRETKIVFAAIVGLLTVMIRVLGSNTEGVLFAILLGNLITPYINRTTRRSTTVSLVKALIFVAVVIVAGGFVIGYINMPEVVEVVEFVKVGVMF
jgi:electron transport complex protein RnfD